MIRLAANLSFLFTDLPFLDRFEAASRAGFRAVEYMFPYEFDSDEISSRLAVMGLQQVLFNLPAGDWAAGERGIACHPGRQAEFRAGVELALPLAKKLGVHQLNCLAGLPPAGASDEECRDTMLGNLSWAADTVGKAGVRLLIEPINSRIDMPGFWLDTPDKARDLLELLGHPDVAMQYDVYHAHVMGVDVACSLAENLPRVGHVQVADAPGRHQPGTGDVPYPSLFRLLEEHSYVGWIGCEFYPAGDPADVFSWADRWLRPSGA